MIKTKLLALTILLMAPLHVLAAQTSGRELAKAATEHYNTSVNKLRQDHFDAINELEIAQSKRNVKAISRLINDLERELSRLITADDLKAAAELDAVIKAVKFREEELHRSIFMRDQESDVDPYFVAYWDRSLITREPEGPWGSFAPIHVNHSGLCRILVDNNDFENKSTYSGYMYDGAYKVLVPSEIDDEVFRILAITKLDDTRVKIQQASIAHYKKTLQYTDTRILRTEEPYTRATRTRSEDNKRFNEHLKTYGIYGYEDYVPVDLHGLMKKIPAEALLASEKIEAYLQRVNEGEQLVQKRIDKLESLRMRRGDTILQKYLADLKKSLALAKRNADLSATKVIDEKVDLVKQQIEDLSEDKTISIHSIDF